MISDEAYEISEVSDPSTPYNADSTCKGKSLGVSSADVLFESPYADYSQ